MPYKSKAQSAYFNIHKKELESQGVDVNEWNSASKGKSLPEHSSASTSKPSYSIAHSERKKNAE